MTKAPWIVVRFSNKATKAIELVVEPWATSISIDPNAQFAIHYPAPEDRADTSLAEIDEDGVRFWCEGETFEVEINGMMIQT